MNLNNNHIELSKDVIACNDFQNINFVITPSVYEFSVGPITISMKKIGF